MSQAIAAISNMTEVVILVVFGDVDWSHPGNHRHVMIIMPGGYYMLSLNDTRNYRGEWHILSCEEMMRLETVKVNGQVSSSVSIPVKKPGEKHYSAELKSDGVLRVTESPRLSLVEEQP